MSNASVTDDTARAEAGEYTALPKMQSMRPDAYRVTMPGRPGITGRYHRTVGGVVFQSTSSLFHKSTVKHLDGPEPVPGHLIVEINGFATTPGIPTTQSKIFQEFRDMVLGNRPTVAKYAVTLVPFDVAQFPFPSDDQESTTMSTRPPPPPIPGTTKTQIAVQRWSQRCRSRVGWCL